MEHHLLNICFVLLLIGIMINLYSLWWSTERLQNIIKGIFWLALLSLTATIIARIATTGRLPFASMYEFILIFTWAILAIFVITRQKFHSPIFDLLSNILVALLLLAASFLPSEARPLMPALQSIWLHIHVLTAIIAYGSFAVAFCLAGVYLFWENKATAELRRLDQLIYRLVVLGFVFLSLVIITGAIWAEQVWGNWWTWDPKETWSLVTWLVYAAYLHARRTYNWKGHKSAVMVIIGFVVVLITLFGVSLILPGLHSYI
jgi:ABC-type transport system involved in cytochrome c biogenesis permease subunit